MEAVADGVGEAAGRGQGAQNQGDTLVVEGSKPTEECSGQGLLIRPVPPELDNDILRCRGEFPAGWQEDAYALAFLGRLKGLIEGGLGAFDELQAGTGGVVADADAGGW